MTPITSRRGFLKTVTVVAVTPLAAGLISNVAQSAELPHLEEADVTAAALGYKQDSKKVDAAKYPAHKPTQMCGGCSLAQGAVTDAWRPCSIFPGKLVNSKGWCAAFAAKA